MVPHHTTSMLEGLARECWKWPGKVHSRKSLDPIGLFKVLVSIEDLPEFMFFHLNWHAMIFIFSYHNLGHYFGWQVDSFSVVSLASTSFIFNLLLIISKPLNHHISFSVIRRALVTRLTLTYMASLNAWYWMLRGPCKMNNHFLIQGTLKCGKWGCSCLVL